MRLRSLALLLTGAVSLAHAQYVQQGNKFSGTQAAGPARQAGAVAVSADGNTAIIGGYFDNSQVGAAWVFTRTNGTWTQQGPKLVASDAVGPAHQGYSVAISADGNTVLIGGNFDNIGAGAAWVFTRSNGVWTQQGSKLFGTGVVASAGQGSSVALSADGNTALVGGSSDNFGVGAVWVFARSGSTWTQQGNKLVGTGGVGPFINQGSSVALSADGTTAAIGGNGDTSNAGAVWIFARSGAGSFTQQGGKLVGAGAVGNAAQGGSVSLSADRNTVIWGGKSDANGAGAAWIFTRSGSTWTQQGSKLVGSGAVNGVLGANQGAAVSIAGGGNLVAIGGPQDNTLAGATWIFTRAGNVWTQQGNKLVGTGGVGALQGAALAVSGDAGTLIVGGNADSGGVGAAWAFTGPTSSTPTPGGVTPASGGGSTAPFVFTFSAAGGAQSLRVLNVLIRDVLDGRQACFLAFVPSGPAAGSVYLVDDAGNAGGPYAGMLLPGADSVSNQQCTISGNGSSLVTSGNTATLTLAIAFKPAFAGNKVIYTAAQDAAGNSGWQAVGTWNVPGAAPAGPAVQGVAPGHTAGLSATYTFAFTDTLGFADIAVANVLINTAIDGRKACYVAIVPVSAGSVRVLLVNDAGDAGGPFAEMTVPGTGNVSNLQCAIAGAGSSVSAAGNNLSVTLPVTFSPSFAGNQVFYLAARSNTANSGWQAVGTAAVR